MMRTYHILSLTAAATVITSCRPAPQVSPLALSASDTPAIRATVDSALRIANASPLDAVAYMKAYYTDQARYAPPNALSLQGTAAIVECFAALPPISNVKFEIQEIEGFRAGGVGASVKGAYTFTITPPGGVSIVDSGTYLEIWQKRVDGSWRSIGTNVKSDLPPGPSPPWAKK